MNEFLKTGCHYFPLSVIYVLIFLGERGANEWEFTNKRIV